VAHGDRASQSRQRPSLLTFDRLNALTDAVMAIVMTLLVLQIEIPDGANFRRGLWPFLAQIEHDLGIYAISFLMVATFWVQHHSLFHYLRYVDRTVIWLDLLFLLPVSMLPFTSQLKSAFRHDAESVWLLSFALIVSWLSLAAISWYAMRHRELLRRPVPAEVVSSVLWRIGAVIAVCLAAMVLATASVRLATYLFLAVPLLFLRNRSVDAHWQDAPESVEVQSDQ